MHLVNFLNLGDSLAIVRAVKRKSIVLYFLQKTAVHQEVHGDGADPFCCSLETGITFVVRNTLSSKAMWIQWKECKNIEKPIFTQVSKSENIYKGEGT